MSTDQHTFYNYARDPPSARGPHSRYIKEEVGLHRIQEIPSPCPCQEDPSLSTRQPLRDPSHEEQFWRNLHAFRGFAMDMDVENPAFEVDEKVRREEEMAVVKGDEMGKRKEQGKGNMGDVEGKEDGNGKGDEEAEGKGKGEGKRNGGSGIPIKKKTEGSKKEKERR